MASAWSVANSNWRDIFTGFETSFDLPWTMSYTVRKRLQVDNLSEIPKDKRPPEMTIWFGTSEEIEEWLDRVYDTRSKNRKQDTFDIVISDSDIE